MADQEEEDLKMALRLSMRHSPPEPKWSKPRDATAAGGSSPEDGGRMQGEHMAVAAEKRMLAARSVGVASPPSLVPSPSRSPSPVSMTPNNEKSKPVPSKDGRFGVDDGRIGRGLSSEETYQLFSMVFGGEEAHQLIFFIDPQFVPDSISFALEKN